MESDKTTDTCSLRTATFVYGSYLMFPALGSRARFSLQIRYIYIESIYDVFISANDNILMYNNVAICSNVTI